MPIFTPPLNPHPFHSNWGRKMAAHYVAWHVGAGAGDHSPLHGAARLCSGRRGASVQRSVTAAHYVARRVCDRRPPLGGRTRIVIIIKNECHSNIIVDRLQGCRLPAFQCALVHRTRKLAGEQSRSNSRDYSVCTAL